MPLFEFECSQCGGQFEELIRNPIEEKTTVCPKCGGRDVRKLFSAFGFKSGSKMVSSIGGSGDSCPTCTAKTCDTCR